MPLAFRTLQVPALKLGEGPPPRNGVYVVYTNDDVPMPTARREFAQWHDGQWCHCMSAQRFRGHVYGWVGPLPVVPLSE